MKKKVQTVAEMVMRSHYLNALDIESRAEKPLSEMERQDFINTINDLRETISSLQMTIKTLQKTIDDLTANEKRHKKEIDGLHEMLEFFKNQCEYLQSLNNRHNKQTYSGNSLSQKHRSENSKKGRDEKEHQLWDARTMGNQADIIIRNVKNELFHSAKRLILNEVKGIECLQSVINNQ